MPRFLPVGKDAKGGARFLLAALPALGAVLTALAITGDLVGRMARNHTFASFGAFGAAAVAVFLGALAAFGLREGSNAERRVVYAGLAALGAVAANCLARAVARGVYTATALPFAGALPAWRDRFTLVAPGEPPC